MTSRRFLPVHPAAASDPDGAIRQLEVQNQVLELLAYGEELSVVLETLVRGVESIQPDMLGSVLQFDPGRESLVDSVAPSLPAEFNEAIAIVPIADGVGSCGTAAFRRERVVVSDIASDPLWAEFTQLALPHGLRACWSQPILGRDGSLLGTFAMYYRTVRSPLPEELVLIESAARLASIAIERRIADAALAKARDEALDAARAKSVFLANMSHEIRTPMSGVMGMADLLLQTKLDAEQRDFADTIASCAQSLLRVLNDVLDLSKVEAGRVELEKVGFDVRQLADDVVTLLQVDARRKGLDIRTEVDARIPDTVVGDAGRVRQVLVNLIGNAIKFTSEGGVELRIALADEVNDGLRSRGGRRHDSETLTAEHGASRATRDPSPSIALAFEIEDTGIGIDEVTRARLFQPFVQADDSITRRYGGTGLGLSISRALIELMGGKLDVTSQPGHGSIFHFTIDLGLDRRMSRRATASKLDVSALKGRRILVVDDHTVNARVAEAILTRLGCKVDVVDNGVVALEHVARTEYDAILMDLQMPEMDGITATRQIRALPGRNQETLILAVSASVLGPEREEADRAGIDGWISKPFRRDDLITELIKRLEAA
ncbi:MAG: response regulator [Candidatus Eisenbacteria bacterium]|uniref:histidine kinase n=1 Tax=Eiseniibacteriota bacterium TaxID=2212470 RepID=A0A956NHL2_UNCEI|nr:response regulator [Candidatus Eisenbacteria bacterium]